MPIPGPTPKERPLRPRRSRATDWTTVEDTPHDGQNAPRLPKTRTVSTPTGMEERPLHPMVRTWWDSVRTMPHCRLWTPSDWQFALTTALVADLAFFGGVGAATELRNREKVLGTTADYRRALRIRYVPSAKADWEPLQVTSLDDYRDL